jgi:hypothetical protein
MDSRVNDIAKVHAIYNINASLLYVDVQTSSLAPFNCKIMYVRANFCLFNWCMHGGVNESNKLMSLKNNLKIIPSNFSPFQLLQLMIIIIIVTSALSW